MNSALVGSTDRMVGDRRAIGQVSFAYMWWGVSAIFWNALGSVAPIDQLAFRVVTAFVYLVVGVGLLGRRLGANGVETAIFGPGSLRSKISTAHAMYGVAAALAISANWGLFLWAVSNGQSVEAAFGYFLMPIMAVGLGVGLLGERLRRQQVVALALSVIGIAWSISVLGRLPWIAILVGATFAIYGLLRKQGPWDAVSGLTFETGIIAPLALGFFAFRAVRGEAVFGNGSLTTLVLIVLTGAFTVVPLLAFASSARRVPLSVVGLLQYINPTLQFLVGWQVLGESVSGGRLVGFVWIWLALVFIVVDELKARPVEARRSA